jgi:DNA-binding NtrC family response regulator
MKSRVLVVDDDADMRDVLRESLSKAGFEVVIAGSADDAKGILSSTDCDAVVTDVRMQGMDGIALCDYLTSNRPNFPVIVITAFGTLNTAISAIRAGAYDFVAKPFETEQLVISLNRAVQYRRLQEEVKRLRDAVTFSGRFSGIVGESRAMQDLYELVGRVADSEASVLIIGETGTGKELVARALHQASRRSHRPFVAISCAAVPEPLLESELFGHVKGAFTDARSTRTGLLAEAHGGTLLLDEISSMPLSIQAKVLRALQERTIRPIGGNTEVAVDIRVLAATNMDLEEAVEKGTFREDLLFRLNVIPINVPPLRTRGDDVLLLAQHFINQFSNRSGRPVTGLTPPAAEKLLAYNWPGNVRELQNGIEHAVVLAQHEQLMVEDLPARIREYRCSQPLVLGDGPGDLVSMEEVERRYVARVLEAVGGNKMLASRILGFDRKTLYRKLHRFGLA